MTFAAMATLWLAFQVYVPDSGGFGSERTVGEVLRAHGPPLFTARSAMIEQPRWVLWGLWPVRAARLTTSDLQLVDPDKHPKLAGRVLIYCEGNLRNGWAKLELWTMSMGAQMERATPHLGHEGPGIGIWSMRGDRGRHIIQTDPIRVILVYAKKGGAVDRIVTTRIRELELSYPVATPHRPLP